MDLQEVLDMALDKERESPFADVDVDALMDEAHEKALRAFEYWEQMMHPDIIY